MQFGKNEFILSILYHYCQDGTIKKKWEAVGVENSRCISFETEICILSPAPVQLVV